MGDTEYIKLKVVGKFDRHIDIWKHCIAIVKQSGVSDLPPLFRTRQQRDPLPSEADHTDGQAQEVLQREGRRPGHLPQISVWRPPHQWRRDPEGPGDGTGWRHRGVPGTDWRLLLLDSLRWQGLREAWNLLRSVYHNFLCTSFEFKHCTNTVLNDRIKVLTLILILE